MGDRYIFKGECAYCGKEDDEIYYAPTSNFYTFKCEVCKKKSFIKPDFDIIKLEDLKYEDVVEGFEMTTSINWEEDKMEEMCTDIYNRLKGGLKNDKNKRKSK